MRAYLLRILHISWLLLLVFAKSREIGIAECTIRPLEKFVEK